MSLFCEHSERYSQTWPSSGSMRNGLVFRRPTSVPLTNASVSSSSPGLPTPRARDWKTGGKDGLHDSVRLLKTPTSQLAVNGGSQHPDKRKAGGHGPTLADEVEHLLPTPRATDGTKGGPNQRGSAGDLTLPSAAHRIGACSSPRSAGGKTSQDGQLPGQLTIEAA